MKTNFIQTFKLTLLCLIFFSVVYTALVWGMAQASPNHGNGQLAINHDKVVGYSNLAQVFTADRYFWSRPSAVGYDAAGSGGSNKGPANTEYLKQVQAHIDTFLAHNPSVLKEQIPVELVTASGSGLDPDLTPEAAKVQIARIASVRQMSPVDIDDLITKNTRRPCLGLLGPATVNVLKLNIELDNLTK